MSFVMDSIILPAACISAVVSASQLRRLRCTSSHSSGLRGRKLSVTDSSLRFSNRDHSWSPAVHSVAADTTNSTPPRDGIYTVGDFMTRKADLLVVEETTPVDKALEILVEKRITGFPVIDADWNLVGVVSDYDLLALDSISGGSHGDTSLFPDVDSSWKTFNEIQKLVGKTDGKVVGDLMTPAPLVVHETTNLEEAVRLLLETKYRRLPVVDVDGKLVGLITRGDVVRAALRIKDAIKKMQLSQD
ncbi:CBS domain-containing protein CBSX1, chloroplastic-like [Cynara cardunculus var. scolymus]|uniref:CBS domain-containing protein CBSX1, chloroplastic-like n=1 Tax=Cynara cardunculus var. scolymus TaxID=59895 RepID=UPI000D62DCB1|nr:CBS domain-containing protein CBSX1, chloroplastic-like [Cynara cardunculus var. scolymus]